MNNIAENLKRINENIARAAQKSGRRAEDITLIAVTKTITPQALTDMLETLLAAGVCNLGENRVQELTQKRPLFDHRVSWHMIGHLQRNKVKNVVGHVKMIHSVDSPRLAEEISRIAMQKQVVADVLIEINIAGETSKHGSAPDQAAALTRQIAALPGIAPRGLMTVAPFVANPEENRPHFRKMAELLETVKTAAGEQGANMPFLSMGMTNDYEVAIEEGANMVRVGTAIFGERL